MNDSKKNSELSGAISAIGRRDFIRVAAGAAAAIGLLNGVGASAQAPASQGVRLVGGAAQGRSRQTGSH